MYFALDLCQDTKSKKKNCLKCVKYQLVNSTQSLHCKLPVYTAQCTLHQSEPNDHNVSPTCH